MDFRASIAGMVVSRQHSFVRACRAVAAGRGEADTILLDGDHVIGEALAAGVRVTGLLTSMPDSELARAARARGVPVHEASSDALDAASPVRTPTGVVALAHWSPVELDALFAPASPLIVGVVGVQDPGNVGGIIRSADALGATGVVALEGTAHPGGWKALRGAMGSTFHLTVGVGIAGAAVARARERGARIVATVPVGGEVLDGADLSGPLLLLVGSEGAGLPPNLVAEASVRVTIPMRSGTNSLNVGVSTALILWEARRSRSLTR